MKGVGEMPGNSHCRQDGSEGGGRDEIRTTP